jgi:hypothetical protein
MNCFNFRIIFFTLSATLNVKSGLSTVNNISGLKSSIAFTVSFIFFLILKIFKKHL